jgi:autotransporter translocation and assembly factor TamB
VRVSRNLTPRLELGGSVGLSTSRDFNVELRYRIVDGLSIDGAYSSEPETRFGGLGVDLRYRREFGGQQREPAR